MKNPQIIWENMFLQEGALWQFEASDSAIRASGIFKESGLKNILIPGSGYGRNAQVFLNHGADVTGIEIAQSAINVARINKIMFNTHHGSVLDMPFDNTIYDGIFCYAVLHLFNKNERKSFLKNCFDQLSPKGQMIFTVISTQSSMYGQGKKISYNRYKLENGLGVYFYTRETSEKEFQNFGSTEITEIDEPIKHIKNEPPLKCFFIQCKKG